MADKKVKEAKITKVKAPKITKEESDNWFVRGIIGTLGLLVLGSITFSTLVIWNGTDELIYKLLLAPQIGFVVAIAFVAFSKILK